MSYDVFISYSSRDLAHAERLHQHLEQAGLKVWFDRQRLHPGFDWYEEIEAACEDSRVVLPVLTPRWKDSEWTRYETYGAEATIPALFEGSWEEVCTPPLERFQAERLDLSRTDAPGWPRLLADIRRRLAQPRPDKGPRLVHLRYLSNPCFVGRERELLALHEALHCAPKALLSRGRVRVIAEMGGWGKTTLARHYAEKFWRCYEQMYWVDCRQGIESEFARLFEAVVPGLTAGALTDADKARRVLWELQQTEGRPARLLVLDDAENEEAILPWIPKTGNCFTLITSRFTAWSPGLETCRVWVLEPEAGRRLLLLRTGHRAEGLELEACDELARKLEYLPLALEQAAAFIVEQGAGFGFRDYLRLYAQAEEDLLKLPARGGTEYPDSVFTTWATTVEKLPPGARAIMRLMAFMASTPVPLRALLRGGALLAETAQSFGDGGAAGAASPAPSEFSVRQWKAALGKYSMVRIESLAVRAAEAASKGEPGMAFAGGFAPAATAGEALSMHGLVQAVERHHVSDEERPRVIERASALLAGIAPEGSYLPAHWPDWQMLLPHVLALIGHGASCRDLQVDPQLLLFSADFLRIQGREEEALALARHSLALLELRADQQPPLLLNTRHLVGLLTVLTGNPITGLALLREVREAREALLGPEHPDTLTSVNDLGWVIESHDWLGGSGEAQALYEQALRGREKVLGPDHRDTLESYNNVANQLSSAEEAEPLFRRALAGLTRLLGPGHADTLITRNNLARMLELRGQGSAAERLYAESIEEGGRALGPEHPQVLETLQRQAELLARRGDRAQAAQLYQSLVSAYERKFGSGQAGVLSKASELAGRFYQRSEYRLAEPLFRAILRNRERELGPDHPETLASASNLANLLHNKGDHAAAEPLYRFTLTGCERTLGPLHENTVTSLTNLAQCLIWLERNAEAEGYSRRALQLREAALGEDHPDLADAVELHANILGGLGRREEALRYAERAVQLHETKSGSEHPELSVALTNTAVLLRDLKRFAEAEALLRQALAIEEKVRPAGHPKIPHRLNNLAAVLATQPEKLGEAVEVNARAWTLKRAERDVTSARVLWVRVLLAGLSRRSAALYQGQLKTMLDGRPLPTQEGIVLRASMATLLDTLAERLGEERAAWLGLLMEVINEPGQVSRLEGRVEWRDLGAVALEAPWPSLETEARGASEAQGAPSA